MQDYYALLDLPAEFTLEELRAAYKAAMRRYHPDVAGDSPEANAMAVAVNDAYQTFSNHSRRWDYDSAHPEYRLAAERRHAQAAYDRGWDTAGAGRFGREDRTAATGVRREPKPWAEPSARAPSSGFSPGIGDVGDSSISRWNDGGRDLRQAGRPDGAPKVDGAPQRVAEGGRRNPLSDAIYGINVLLLLVLVVDFFYSAGAPHRIAETLGLLWCCGGTVLAEKFASKGETWRELLLSGGLILLSGLIACAFAASMTLFR